ncbi:hypothetical protein [Gordonia spumicola]|uniref:hypothetical protein n=1 Tax=Gordonia spumicola TaxID=589161 RepID=UPI001379B805|nr:hypothetical protein [Gordonia spumicola]
MDDRRPLGDGHNQRRTEGSSVTALLYIDQGWISVTGTDTTVTVARSWLVARHHDMYRRTEQFTRGCTLASTTEVDAPSDGSWIGARIIIETFDR